MHGLSSIRENSVVLISHELLVRGHADRGGNEGDGNRREKVGGRSGHDETQQTEGRKKRRLQLKPAQLPVALSREWRVGGSTLAGDAGAVRCYRSGESRGLS